MSRITLRRILLTRLDERVRFGKACERYEVRAGGKVLAVFSDGSTAEVDILVGADGAGGKLHLTESTEAWLPNPLLRGWCSSTRPLANG